MAGLALEIVDVRVDGVLQTPTDGGVAREDTSVYPEPVDGVVYQANPEYLSVSRWKEGKRQGGLLLMYSVPHTAERIDIRYVIHLRDGSSSKEITVTSFEINALEGIGPRTPNKAPLRMPVSGTPAADAPVAPPSGIAGR